MINLSTFGARVKYLRLLTRDEHDPTQPASCSEIDRLAGLYRGHVWQIEGGENNPKAETVRSLAGVFGCSVGWLLAREGSAPAPSVVQNSFERAREEFARRAVGGSNDPSISDGYTEDSTVGHSVTIDRHDPDVVQAPAPVPS